MNSRLWQIDQRMHRRVKQVLFQYDSAIYEVPEELVSDHEALIKDVWAEPVVVPATGRSFIQKIDLKRGRRWSSFG